MRDMIDKYIVDLNSRDIVMKRDTRQIILNIRANRLKYIRILYKILYITAYSMLIINLILLSRYLPLISLVIFFMSYYLSKYYSRNSDKGILM